MGESLADGHGIVQHPLELAEAHAVVVVGQPTGLACHLGLHLGHLGQNNGG